MGTWAEGNFDNDAALDFVADIADEVAKEMASAPTEVEAVELVMAAVATRKVLIEHCSAPRPEVEEISRLRDAVLRVYDEQIDGLQPEDDFKVARRKVIEQTFDEFIALLDRDA